MEWSERCWAEVDLGALRRNYRQLRQRLSPGGKYLAVVKADAYGHGAVPVARVLQEEGADWFGVASLEEGEELRQGGITRPVLIFGYTPPQYAGRLAEEELTQGVFSAGYAAARGMTIEDVRTGISRSVGYMVSRLFSCPALGTLLVTGGDTLPQCMDYMGARELQPLCELEPGVVLSRFTYQGYTRYIISKSGGFGEAGLIPSLAAKLARTQERETLKEVYSYAESL